MKASTRSEALGRTALSWLALLFLLLAPRPVLADRVCSSNCEAGPCTLHYSATSIVRDNTTGAPIAGAQITLLDASGVSAADGSYSVSGSRAHQCQYDYVYSFSVTAPGYEPFYDSGYATGIVLNYEVRLNPVSPSGGHVVSGIVAEFPMCIGAMRGVTVVLEPLGITTQTSIDASEGGRFAFRDVPPGHYTLRVLNGCNPYGCWDAASVRVDSDNVNVTVCMTAIGPAPSPTPTPTPYAGPSATFTVCPIKTPCVLGERPKYCEERCGVGCGCETCPSCGPGELPANEPNRCDCIPEGGDPTPTPTRTPPLCLFPTPPFCPVGQTANCPPVPCGSTDAGCFCQTCPPCPEDQVYSGAYNSCACVDPRTFTHTPTPANDDGSPTPTPAFCALPTPPRCPTGQEPHCVSNECVVGCGCEPCAPCPEGLIYSGEINRCECVDPNAPPPTPTPNGCPPAQEPLCAAGEYVACGPDCGCDCLPCADCPPGLERDDAPNSCVCVDPRLPSEPPTATPTPFAPRTPTICPSRTPLSCDEGESIVCDASVDPCGCECRAVPQQPSGNDATSSHSAGGCGIVAAHDPGGSLFSWSLLVIATMAWRFRTRRAGEPDR